MYLSPFEMPPLPKCNGKDDYHNDPVKYPTTHRKDDYCPVHREGAILSPWQEWYACREAFAATAGLDEESEKARQRSLDRMLSVVTATNPPDQLLPVQRTAAKAECNSPDYAGLFPYSHQHRDKCPVHPREKQPRGLISESAVLPLSMMVLLLVLSLLFVVL